MDGSAQGQNAAGGQQMSAHAKRRLQKRLKKEQEMAEQTKQESPASDSGTKADDINKKSEQESADL